MTEDTYHLVHVNIATARAPMDDRIMRGFVEQMDEIDALAQSSPGFIDQPGIPDEGKIYPEGMLVNVSVWDSIENLKRFTYTGRHLEAFKRRSEWFHQTDRPNYVLYWAPAQEIPTEVEIHRRFEYLNEYGPTPYAFSFSHHYTVEEMLNYQIEGKG